MESIGLTDLHDEQKQTTGASAVTRPSETAGKGPQKLLLSEIPTSGRFFWKQSTEEQLNQTLWDKYPYGTQRPLPKYEILVMALNEIAVHYRYGFFCYLVCRDTQDQGSKEEKCAPTRLIPPAG